MSVMAHFIKGLRSSSLRTITKLIQTSAYSTTSLQTGHTKFIYNPCIHLAARTNLDVTIGNYKTPLPAIDIPSIKDVIENPNNKTPFVDIRDFDSVVGNIELPNINIHKDIQAARLIVIRRRKMKKHKLKKLRKKMKFEWAKVRQRRELRKEKAFQAVLIAQIKEAEKFSAEQYVADKIRQATENPIPRFWKGKRLPQFIIKQKLGIK